MPKPLTVKSLAALKPDPARRREIPDGGLPGLYLVIQPSGAMSWALRYRHAGKPRKLTLGRYPALGLAAAREAARGHLEAIERGADPAAAKQADKAASRARKVRDDPDRDLVRGLVRDFLKRHASRNRTGDEIRRMFDNDVLPFWGHRRVDAIGKRDVIEMLDRIIDRGATVRANRVLAAVRKLFNWAVGRDVIALSPCAGVRPPTLETKRERVLNDAELRLFWLATERLGQPFGPLFRLLLLTGQRRDEVAGMTDAELEGDVWVIPASRSKNKREHRLPLSRAALAILDAQPRIAWASLVFTTNGRNPVSGFGKAKARLDALIIAAAKETDHGTTIPEWRLHDLRRTAATDMARCGVALPVVEKVLNHVSGSFGGVAGVYQRHSYADEMRAALDAWAAFVERIVNPDDTAKVVPLAKRTTAAVAS